jgi:hypothetical protein
VIIPGLFWLQLYRSVRVSSIFRPHPTLAGRCGFSKAFTELPPVLDHCAELGGRIRPLGLDVQDGQPGGGQRGIDENIALAAIPADVGAIVELDDKLRGQVVRRAEHEVHMLNENELGARPATGRAGAGAGTGDGAAPGKVAGGRLPCPGGDCTPAGGVTGAGRGVWTDGGGAGSGTSVIEAMLALGTTTLPPCRWYRIASPRSS